MTKIEKSPKLFLAFRPTVINSTMHLTATFKFSSSSDVNYSKINSIIAGFSYRRLAKTSAGNASLIHARKVSIRRFYKNLTLLESMAGFAVNCGMFCAQWLKMLLKTCTLACESRYP